MLRRTVPPLTVLVAAFALGMVTSWAQGFLPAAVNSFANSASGWTVLTVLLLAAGRFRAPAAGFLGAGCFVLLTLGYAAASALRGFTYDPTLFVVVGLVVGPFVGVATAWSRRRDLRAALGTAALSGIGIGEALYGVTVVGETTSPVYWTLIGVVGAALLVAQVLRLRGWVPRVVAVALTAVVVGAFLLAYSNLYALV